MRSSLTMIIVSRLLHWFGFFCALAIIIPSWSRLVEVDRTTQTFTLGLSKSPWLIVEQSETKSRPQQESKSGTSTAASVDHHQTVSIRFLSWSTLALVVGITLMVIARKLYPKPTRPTTT